jgi:hypothetical protein
LLFRSRAGLDFHQSIQELRLDPRPRSLPAAIDDRRIRRHAESGDPQSKSLAEGAIREWAFGPQFRMQSPVWRFGNSRAKETSGFAELTDTSIRLSDNLLLGRFGPPTLP